MTCGFEETIKNIFTRDGPDDVTVRADVTWKNLGFLKKYRLADLSIIGTKNMIANPWFDLTGFNYTRVYENCVIRKMPDDDALVYAITSRSHDADTGGELYGSNYQWGLYNGQKVIYCRPCCDLNNIYVYAYKWRPVTDGAYGLSIYGSDGTIIYNSNLKYLKIKSTYWGYTYGYGDRISSSDSGVAITMPFDSLAFKGNFSAYAEARYFLSSYSPQKGTYYGELNGVLIGDGLNNINLIDTYYFSPAFSRVDVSNL